MNVPVFNCIVYVTADAQSGVRARVANLVGLQATGNSEREALAIIVPAFKQRLSELLAGGQPIPWIDPPAPLQPGEQQRMIAVHL